MITLDNVSPKVVVPYYNYIIKSLLLKKGAKSVQDVLDLMSEHKEYGWGDVKRIIGKVEKLMNDANERGCEPEIYLTKGYEDPELLAQDEMNFGDVLLLNNPTYQQVTYSRLKYKPIREIKDDLAHTMPNGKNYISGDNTGYRYMGSSYLPRIKLALEMFEDQIERQAELTPERDDNLFVLDGDAKREIVEQVYGEIVEFLVDNAENALVWSELSDVQKKLYISSIINSKQSDIKTRENIISYVADYTTILELEQVANHDLRVLKRFIVK